MRHPGPGLITASPPPSSPPVGMSTVRTIFFNLLAQLKGQPDENRDSISIQLILPPSKYPLPPYIPLKQNVLILCFCHPLPYYWNQVQNLESAQATLSLSLKLSISNTSHHLNPSHHWSPCFVIMFGTPYHAKNI